MREDEAMPKWTRDRIIRDILRREADGLPLASAGGKAGVDYALYRAASRMFGSWRNAVVSAGLPAARARSNGEWTPSRIMTVIRTLARRRSRLRAQEVLDRYGQLVPAARRCFGSWAKAVYAAGVNPQKLQRTSNWTRERILECILVRAINNESLDRPAVKPRALVDAGTKLFGSWRAALAEAGIASEDARPEIRKLTVEEGSVLSPQDTILRCDFDGVAHRKGTRWSEREILQSVIERFVNNKPINASAVHSDHSALYRAATKRFGNWRNTLLAAGLPITPSKG